MKARLLAFCLLALWGSPVGAAMLGIPAPNVMHSGVGVISGWKCEAEGDLTIVFNDDGKHIPLLYGSERTDVRKNGACPQNAHDNVGFVAIWNWGNLGGGLHSAVVYDNGVAFARRKFHVATFGEAFVTGAQKGTMVTDFPFKGDESYFQWNQATQHFELFNFYPGKEPEPEPLASEALAFLLDQDYWTIEVPDIEAWTNISSRRHPTNEQGNLLAPAPAGISFFRYERGVTPWRDYPAMPPRRVNTVGWLQGTRYNAHQEALREGLPHLVELGEVLDVLPAQTAVALGVEADRYALVVTSQIGPGGNPKTRDFCYILVFNTIWRTDTGGLSTRAFFAITERSLRSTQHPWQCIAPILTSGLQSTALTIK